MSSADAEARRLRAELEALLPLVEERDRLVEERDQLEGALRGADQRIAELTYQRDLVRWRMDRLNERRFMRIIRAILNALKSPARLLRLPLTLVRVLMEPSKLPEPPVEPDLTSARRSIANRARSETRTDVELRRRFLTPPDPAGTADLRVAGILDTFSASSFAPDCDLMRFRPDNWREVLEQREPHLLLVESAWQGNDGAWQYQVGSYTYPDSIGLPHLTELVEWCREHDVPTVFWNKEDPVHFDKFKEAAQRFDVVLTTDADRIPAYQALPGLRAHTVGALPFAAQPAIHHPIGAPADRDPIPVFAGTYYKNRHAERREQLEMLLDAARPMGLRIFDRMHGKESDSVGYPERFASHISGGLPYDEMVRAYKRYRVFLNTNSVTASPTMFSRRVFELLASGTPVVSTPSLGMQEMFGDLIDVVETTEDATEAIRRLLEDDEHWHRRSRAGLRRVMAEHTYAHRLVEVAQHAGFDLTPFANDGVTLVALDDGDPTTFRVVHDLLDARGVDDALLGTLDASGPLPHPRARRLTQSTDDVPARFRELADAAGTPWLLVVSSAGEVDPSVVGDLRLVPRYADADVVGSTAEGARHRFVDTVSPSPVLVRRDLVARDGWHLDPAASASHQDELRTQGVRLYAADVSGGS